MAPTYITNDGETIEAAGAHELIKRLYETSRSPTPTLSAFKEDLAVRIEQQTGLEVDTSDAALVEALLKTGLVTVAG